MKNDKQPLITVVIPVYNVERYVQKCLISLLQQIPCDEGNVICVDDGSEDTSGIICDSVAKQYDNVTVIHINNQGVANARAIGLKLATGRYVTWCDSDDYYANNWYASIRGDLQTGKSDVILIGYAKKKNNVIQNIHYGIEGEVDRDSYAYYISCDNKIKSYLYTHIIKREIANQIEFDISLDTYEDYDYCTKLVPYINSIKIIDKCLYYYVYRDTSITNAVNLTKLLMGITVAEKRCRFFTECNLRYNYGGYWKSIIVFCVKSSPMEEDIYYKRYRRILKRNVVNIFKDKEFILRDKFVVLMIILFPKKIIEIAWKSFMINGK